MSANHRGLGAENADRTLAGGPAAPPGLRVRLAVFVMACSAIVITAAAVLLYGQAREERAATEARALETALRAAQFVEKEIAVAEALLTGLASSRALAEGDLGKFHREASDVKKPPRAWIVLYGIDALGSAEILVNTRVAWGSPMPARRADVSSNVTGIVKRTMATRETYLSDVLPSSVQDRPIVGVAIPVMRETEVPYVLAAVLPEIGDLSVFDDAVLPPQWFGGVVDKKGVFLPTRPTAERTLQRPVLDAPFRPIVRRSDGMGTAVTQDGQPLHVAYSLSTHTGFTAIVAIPEAILDAPGHRALLIAGGAGTLLLLTVAGIAFAAEPRVTRPLQRRIAEDEARLRVIADSVPSILFTMDADSRCDYVSAQFYAFTGLPAGAGQGRGWADALHPEDRQALSSRVGPSPREVAALDMEFRLKAEDGSYRWFFSRIRALHDAEGNFRKWFGTATDIDHLKQTEQALTRAETDLRRLSAQLMKGQDDERRRIAREIHDTTLQDLVAAALQVDQVREGRFAAVDARADALDEVRSLLDRAQQDLRTLSYLLHPPMLDELGLATAIRWYARGYTKRSGIEVTVDAPDTLPRLPSDVATTLFRIVQEGLANVHRHSASPDARITLEWLAGAITLTVADRGKGMAQPIGGDPDADGKDLGVGLPGMALRLQQIGGALEIDSNAGGTTLRVTVPHAQGAPGAVSGSGLVKPL